MKRQFVTCQPNNLEDGIGNWCWTSMPYSISVESIASRAFLNDILKESLWEWTMKWAGTYCGPTLVPDLRWASWMNIVLEVGHLKNYNNFRSKQHHFLHTCSIQHTRRLPITRESYSSAFNDRTVSVDSGCVSASTQCDVQVMSHHLRFRFSIVFL